MNSIRQKKFLEFAHEAHEFERIAEDWFAPNEMYCLVKAFGKTKPNAESGFIKNVIQRYYKNKSKLSNHLHVNIDVVGSGSLGDPAALVVKTSNNFLYLFNCGEGTFRLLHAKWYRFRYLSHVFCTSNRWERIGGIPSLARAVFERNSQFPTFHGPPQLEQCLDKFAELTDLDPEFAVTDRQFDQESYFHENHIQVDSVTLNRTNASNSDGETVVAYVCRLLPRRGSLLLKKIADSNMPFEHVKAIIKGNDVALQDGTTVFAKDYLSTGFAGGNFLVIDVPSRDYLADLERNHVLNEHIGEINSGLGIEFVAHFTSSDIIETPEYQKFMRLLNAKRHLALNETNMYSGLKHVHSMQHTLNQLNAEIYPHLSSKFQPLPQTFTSLDSVDMSVSDLISTEPTTSETRYIFPSVNEIGDKELAVAADDEEERDSSGEDCVTEEETKVYTTLTRVNAFPKIIFFGTGSSFTGVRKSATSILVRTSLDSSILLDCGEGSVGQMCRFYGSRTEDIVRSIKALHITHMHSDHHAGVMDLIRIRQRYMPENRPKLLLMAPKQAFESLLNFYEEHFGNVRDEFTMIDNEDLLNGLPDDLKSAINVKDLRTCRVPHMDISYAISLDLYELPAQKKDFKLTFSGDTPPCESLVELGKNSSLLIHEATFEDTLANRAAFTKHSTISQAIEQSEKMQAKYTLLTHFSQRYRVLPPINDDLMKNKKIGIALDFMEVIPDDLAKLNDLYFKLKETYAEDLRFVEEKSERYALRNKMYMI